MPDKNLLSEMAWLSSVAYDDSSIPIINQLQTSSRIAAFSGSLTALTDANLQDPSPGPGESFASYFSGGVIFRNANAEAIVAVDQTRKSLFIAFRGTDGTDGTADFVNDLELGFNFQAHYNLLKPLIRAIDAYVSANSSIQNVYVTGHSLGGAMAEQFMTESDHQSSIYHAITFESPGISSSILYDNRVYNYVQTGDPVAHIPILHNIGSQITVDLPDEADVSLGQLAFDYLNARDLHEHGGYEINSLILTNSPLYVFSDTSTYITMGDTRDDTLNVTNSAYKNFLIGFSGNDNLQGSTNNDLIDGGRGNDTLAGGWGDDRLTGGPGDDTYQFRYGDGNDVINEYGGGGQDVIQIFGDGKITDLSQLTFTTTGFGHNLLIQGSGVFGSITIENMDQPGSQVEILQLIAADGHSQIGVDLDLVNIFKNHNGNAPPPLTTTPPPNTAPTVAGSSQALSMGTVLSAVKYWRGIDRDGDAIVSYTINDAAGNGYFKLGSTHEQEGQSFTLTATQFANLQYVVGPAGTSDTFTIRASDSQHPGGGAASTFTVVGLNPAIVPVPNTYTAHDDTATTTSGHPIVISVLANDDSHLTKITTISGADSQFVVIKPDTQDAIIVAPPSNFVGSYHFSYTATDGNGASATAQVTVNVGAYNPTPAAPVDTNHAPVAPDVHQTINVGQQENINPLIFAYDVDPYDQGGVLSLVNHGNAGHGTLTQSGNAITYTPTSGYVGNDQFSYTIQDTHSAQATGTISVTVNQPPTAQDDFIVTDPNTPVTFNVLQNDLHTSGDTLTLLSTSFGPSHGSMTFDASGNVTYTPAGGYAGIDTFNYLAYDGMGGYGQATATIAIGASSVQTGGSGNDILVGTSGNDLLQGLGGDDKLSGGAGDDTLDGGSGFNYADYSNAPGSTNITLVPPAVAGDGTVRWDQVLSSDGFGTHDSLRNIDGIIGSQQSDTIEGNDHDNIIYGNGGDDQIQTHAGHDTVYGGDGNDNIQGVSTGFYFFFGGNGNDVLVGGSNSDLLVGGDGNDFIVGNGGADTLLGGNGDDNIQGSGTLDGGAGNDTLRGRGTLIGGAGDDLLQGNSGNDTLLGGDGNDTLVASAGSNTYDGGNGTDLVEFNGDQSGVIVDLAAGFAQTSTGFDILRSIEVVQGSAYADDRIYGSDAADTLYGNYGNDTLVGRGGNDVIDGGVGNDIIEGGGGADQLTGGAGTDRFVYRDILDGGDTITDFQPGLGGDVLDFADVLRGVGYLGSTPITDGYLRLVPSGSNTVVQIDTDGFGLGAGFETLVTLQNVSYTSLSSANFASSVDLFADDPLDHAPTVANRISDQIISDGKSVNFVVPANTFADIDGDLLTYSATLADGSTLPAWLNFDPSTRTFSSTSSVSGLYLTIRVTADDGRGNGVSTDFALGTSSSASPISFQSEQVTNLQSHSIVLGDFNGDGKLDLATVNDTGSSFTTGSVSVSLGNGDGTFQAAASYATGTYSTWVGSGDINGDGKTDLVVVNQYSDNLSVLLGNGDGTFQSKNDFSVGNSPGRIAVADLNGDQKADMIIASAGSSNAVTVLLGGGTQTSTYTAGNTPSSVAIGDLNGDGNRDFAVTNYGDNTVSVFWGNGNGTFQTTPSTFSTENSPVNVAIADLNGDDKNDIVVANQSGSVSVLLNNGSGSFLPEVKYTVGSYPSSVATADLNGDGHPDLVVTNSQDNTVSILLGNGNGTFQTQFAHSVGAYPTSVAIGDINGDHKPDIAAADDTVTVLRQSSSNRAPELTYSIPNQVATEGTNFTYQVPSDVFADPDGNALTYSAALTDGTALPAWLSFNAITRTFSGTAPAEAFGVEARVTANDGQGGTASTDFTLTTPPATTIASPTASDWSQSLSYQHGQAVVPLGNMVIDRDPNVQLAVQLVLADPTVGALSADNGATFDPLTGSWSVNGTEAQVNAALASVSFEPYPGREGDTTISTFMTDGTNPAVAGLITLNLQKTPTIINGTDGDDVLFPQVGDNLIFGGLGNNEVDYRYSGAVGITVDLSHGTATGADGRHDALFNIQSAVGTDFNDILLGDAGNNQLLGSYGNDTISGGSGGIDTLTGGPGADTFIFSNGSGVDTITDFNPGEGDKIDLTGVAGAFGLSDVLAHAVQSGSNTIIDFGNGDTLTLDNVNEAALTAADFVFAKVTPPTVISIVCSVAAGTIHTGDKITLSVTMSAGVTVVGPDIPTLSLNDNSNAVYDAAATAALNDATKLVFDYTVQPQDQTADLRVVGINTLTSGIQDSAGNIADLSLAGVSGADTHLGVNAPPTYTWNDGASGDWSTALDWSGAVVPDSMSNATVAGTGTETVAVSSNQAVNVLTLSDANAILAIASSATLSVDSGLAISAAQEIDLRGTLSLGGGAQTIDKTTIRVGGLMPVPIPGMLPNISSGNLNVQQGTALTFGPNLTVDLAYGQINAFSASSSGFSLINDGTITADTNGGIGNIYTWAFDNEGTIAVSNGDTLTLTAQGTNIGSPLLPLSVNNGLISVSSGGHLNISGHLGGSGALVISGGTLELSGMLSDAVTFASGAVGTLQLDGVASANPFIGTLSGLSTGDMIDFANATVTQAVINGNTLTATLANGQTTNISVVGSLPPGDSLQLKLDGKGGTDVVVSDGPLPPPPTYTWNDGTNGDWSTASDWSGGVVPDGTSNATIAGAGTETVTISSNEATNELTLSDANATLAIGNSTTLSVYGGLAISAAQEIDLLGTLSVVGGAQTFDHTTIKIGSLTSMPIPGFPPFVASGNLNAQGTVVTFGPDLTIDLAYGQINAAIISPSGFTLVNDGTITADTNGGSGYIFTWAFDNEGTIAVSNGDTLTLNAVGFAVSPLFPSSANNGTISVGSGGHLNFYGFMGGSGSFIIGDGGTLELGGTLSNDVTFAAGAVGTLQLDGTLSGNPFIGTLSGLSTGDAIDFAGGIVTQAVINGNTLTATFANGQTTSITVAGSLPPGDSLQIKLDGKGGTDVVVANGALPPPPTYTWNDGTSGDWSTASDWSDGVVPDGTSNAAIAGTGTETVTVSSNEAVNVLALSDANSTLAIGNFTTLSAYGGLAISAAREIDLLGTLSVGGGAQTLDNTTIRVGGLTSLPGIPGGIPTFTAFGNLNVQPGTVVTFGPNLTVDLEYGSINAFNFSPNFALINQGTIIADTNGGSGNISTWTFDNEGTIAVSNGDTLVLSAQGASAGSSLPVSVNNGTISVGSGGHLTLAGYMGGSGSFVINDRGTLELGGTLSNEVTFAAGAVGTLQLDGTGGAKPFTGTLSGLSTGDAIDFGNETVTQAFMNSNILTAVLANGQITTISVAGSLPAGDSLQIRPDGKGGSDVVVSTLDTIIPTVAITDPGGLTDHAAQTISGTIAAGGVAVGATVTLFDTVNGITTQLGTATVANGSWTTHVTLAGNGLHSIVAVDTDVAGNTGVSTPVVFTLDTVGPVINQGPQIASVADGGVVYASGRFTATDSNVGAALTWGIVGGSLVTSENYQYGIDEFSVDKNISGIPTTIFDDTFTGSVPPAGPNFLVGSTPASGAYSDSGGTYAAGDGTALLNGSHAAIVGYSLQPAAYGAPVFGQFTTLLTGTSFNAAPGIGLRSSQSFSVKGLFDLTTPADSNTHYGIRLSDRASSSGTNSQPGTETVDIGVIRNAGGTASVVLNEYNFETGVVTTLAVVPVNAASGDNEILLQLSNSAATNGQIQASFTLEKNVNGVEVADGTTTLTVDGRIFDNENWTRPQFYGLSVATPSSSPQSDSVLQGAYGTLDIAQNGTWQYFLNPGLASVKALATGQTAQDVFTVAATDVSGLHGTQTVSVNVTGINDAPVLTSGSLTVSQGGTVLVTLANIGVTDPDSTSFTFTVSNVDHGTFQTMTDGANWIDSSTFTTADLAANHVRYVDGGSQAAPTFSIQANDGTTINNLSNVLVGTVNLTAPALTESLTTDTGSSAVDKITSNDALTGTGPADTLVHFIIDGVAIAATATANAQGVWSLMPTGLADGAHTIVAQATDLVGNIGSSGPLSFTLDTLAPTVAISNTGGLTNQATQTISGIVTAGEAAVGATVYLYDNGSATPIATAAVGSGGAWTANVTLLGDGTHSVVAQDTDAAGNIGSSSPVMFTLDATPPVLTPVSNQIDQATGPNGAVATFAATATDVVDGTEAVVFKEGTTIVHSGDSFGLGTHTITASATDTAGNTASESFSISVVDTTPPSLNSIANQTDEARSATGVAATFAATATDNVDGTDPVVFKEGNTVVHSGDTFGLGTHTITASATDAAGNSSSEQFSISVVDTTPPVLTAIANQTDEATSAAGAVATFAATATDLVDGTDPVIFKEGSTVIHSGDTFSFGTHTITASAIDAAGNTASKSFSISVVDTHPTVTAVAASPNSGDRNTGSVINLTLTMSKSVTVIGAPALTLNDGGTAVYSSGSGSNLLNFTYSVGNAQNASVLAVTGNNLNGSTVNIIDAAGAQANLSGADVNFPGLAIGATVQSVTSTQSSADLGPGKVVTFAVIMTEAVKITGGAPTLSLNDGGVATYKSGSGTNALTFTYTVGALGSAQNTPALAVTRFNLNGATIYDSNVLADTADLSGVTSFTTGPQIDTTAPSILSVAANPTDGDLDVGNTVALTVKFSESVTVAGSPYLALNDGGKAIYATGSGSDTLTFTYVVAAGQNTPDLTVTSLNTNGGSVRDGAGNNAVLSGAITNPAGILQIDTKVPAVTERLLSDTGVSNIDKLTSNDMLMGGGDPNAVVAFTIDGVASGVTTTASSTGAWTFTPSGLADGSHTVLASETDGAGNSGTASLTFTLDATAPVATAIVANPSDADLGAGSTVTMTVTFDRPVQITGTPYLQLNDGGRANYASGAGTNTLTFNYLVAAGQNTSDLTVTGYSTGIQDGAGNAANLGAVVTNPTGTLQIDTKAPTISSIVVIPATANLDAGNTVALTVNFSENVIVTGTPLLTLNDGGTAIYAGGSGTVALTFNYLVATGDNTPDLTVTGLTLNGATITDGALNNAVLTGAVKNPTGVLKIDTIAPTVTKVLSSVTSGEVTTGHAIRITVDTSEAVSVSGAPILLLNDGGTASYDAAHSTAKALAFNYTIAAGQVTTDLVVSGIQLASNSSIADLAGNNANLSGVGADLGLQINTASTGQAGPSGGSFTVNASTDLELFGPSTASVAFAAGSTGMLKLDASSQFTGTVAGLALGNYIDLSDLTYQGNNSPAYHSTGTNTGTLAVTEGASTINIALLGNYLASSFVTSSDGHGGTLVTDPPLTQQASLGLPQHA